MSFCILYNVVSESRSIHYPSSGLLAYCDLKVICEKCDYQTVIFAMIFLTMNGL